MKTIQEIADYLQSSYMGDGQLEISGVGNIESTQPGQIIFAIDKSKFRKAEESDASAIIAPPNITESSEKTIIFNENPRLAFARMIHFLHPPSIPKPEIHPTAVISETAQLGKGVSVMAYSVIGEGCVIGDQTIIYPHVVVNDYVKIGNNSVIRANVTLYDEVEIGNRVIIHSGTVIGSDGFGYVMDKSKGAYYKIPQIGKVIIEDDVEIGANVTIDRGAIGDTRIKQGTKIDNLVQIGHNCVVGEHTTISGQAGLSGSVTVGRYAVLAGQVGVADHVTIGDEVILAARSGISKSLPKKGIYWGSPVQELVKEKKSVIAYWRLPEWLDKIKKMQKEFEALKAKIETQGD